MPKVSPAYFEKKKEAILDSAEKLCQAKPLYRLTMKDIVEETGLSFGAVYDSFADIDAVIAALINRLSAAVDFRGDTERILRTESAPEEKLAALFRYFLAFARATVRSYGKINHEMGAIFTDERRREKIVGNLRDPQAFIYGLHTAIDLIEKHIESGYFAPMFSKESIYALLLAFFDGVLKHLTLSACYGISTPYGVTWGEEDLPDVFISSILTLLHPSDKREVSL